jgi:hypothetical protein
LPQVPAVRTLVAMTLTHSFATAAADKVDLSLPRLYALRAGYLFMGLGLAAVKWPHLADAADLSLYEGVTLCLLAAMSVLALLGLRYPVRLMPVLLFESAWKLLWLGVVALPRALDGDLDSATTQVLTNCTFVVVILAVVPWPHVVRSYLWTPGDRWR